jgi:hypothetical protein
LAGTEKGKERVDLILKRKREKAMYVGQQDEFASADSKNLAYNLIDAHWMGRFHLFIYGKVRLFKTVKLRINLTSFNM